MNKFSKFALFFILAISFLKAEEFQIDKAHSNVGFSVKHMMITNVHGSFKDYNATIDYDEATKTFSKLSAVIDTNSIDTKNEKRDNHLRSSDFFDSEKFPTMTFEMTSYKTDGEDGKIQGNLTIKDVTKPITLEIEDIKILGDKIGFEIEGKINREDFGLKWNQVLEFGGVAVSNEVKIKIDVQAIKK